MVERADKECVAADWRTECCEPIMSDRIDRVPHGPSVLLSKRQAPRYRLELRDDAVPDHHGCRLKRALQQVRQKSAHLHLVASHMSAAAPKIVHQRSSEAGRVRANVDARFVNGIGGGRRTNRVGAGRRANVKAGGLRTSGVGRKSARLRRRFLRAVLAGAVGSAGRASASAARRRSSRSLVSVSSRASRDFKQLYASPIVLKSGPPIGAMSG